MANISSSRWLDYAMNFLAVCMGIAITFGGESIVRSKAEKKEVASSLSLVRDELLDNKSYIEQSDSVLAVFADAAGFLFFAGPLVLFIQASGIWQYIFQDACSSYCA